MKQKLKFYCLGAAHIDVKARALHRPSLGESIKVTTTSCLGGVACNIAVNLAHAGARVALCSLVGRDPQGRSIKRLIKSSSIEISDLGLSEHSPTGQYYAILSEDGELFVATADMAIYEELTPERVMPLIQRSFFSDLVIDANLPKNTIEAIAQDLSLKQRLWGVGVSAYKTARLAGGISRLHGLLVNRQELSSLCEATDLTIAMQTLVKQGCSRVIVSAGALGVYYCQGPVVTHRACPSLRVVDVTGAGDAFSAGVIYSLAQDDDFEKAIDLGFSLAAKALSTPSSCLLELPSFKRGLGLVSDWAS